MIKVTLTNNDLGYFFNNEVSVCYQAIHRCLRVNVSEARKVTALVRNTPPDDKEGWRKVKIESIFDVFLDGKWTTLYAHSRFINWMRKYDIPKTFWVKKVS